MHYRIYHQLYICARIRERWLHSQWLQTKHWHIPGNFSKRVTLVFHPGTCYIRRTSWMHSKPLNHPREMRYVSTTFLASVNSRWTSRKRCLREALSVFPFFFYPSVTRASRPASTASLRSISCTAACLRPLVSLHLKYASPKRTLARPRRCAH